MSFNVAATCIIIAFFMISIWVKTLIQILLALIIAPKSGLRCNQISILWWMFWYEDGKWSCKYNKFSLVFQYVVVVDISKPIPEDIDRKEKKYTLLCDGILLVISVAIFLLCKDFIVDLVKLEFKNPIEVFMAAFAIGMVWHSMTNVFIMVYTQNVVMKRLGGYVDSLIKRLRRGESFDSFVLRPVDELPYKNPSKLEKMMYYNMYLPYLWSVGRIEEMKAPIREMTEYFMTREYILQETLSYYWLIFYYSRYETNKMYADVFFKKVSPTILKDSDANAKRVLAYYYYGVENDLNKAKQYVREGFAVVDKFSIPGSEREMERKLLLELDEMLMRKM